MNKYNFIGKTALITGANRGIGRAFVEVLASLGVNTIYACARNITDLAELTENNPEVIKPIMLDVSNEEHVKLLVSKIDSLDILINNAGIINPSLCSSQDLISIARHEMDVNYFAPLQITQTLLPLLKKSNEAAIINISSIAAISSFPGIVSYSSTKAAIHSYTQGLRAELTGDNIRVIGVYPGPVDTRMTEGWDVEKASPEQIATKTLNLLNTNLNSIFPDSFSEKMYSVFLDHPEKLEQTFLEMM